MPLGQSNFLIRRVNRRLHVTAMASRFYLFVLIATGLFIVVLAASRLLGFIPVAIWEPWMVAIAPAIAVLAALVFYRRPDETRAAHAVDKRMQTKDLFLTSGLIEKAAGEFGPLVRADAEKRAPLIRPEAVVPYDFAARSMHVLLAVGTLLLALLVPLELDPFGFKEEQKASQVAKNRLEDAVSKTREKKELLANEQVDTKHSEKVEQILNDTGKNFRRMDKNDQAGNFRKLKVQKRVLDGQFKKASEKKKDLTQIASSAAFQRIGANIDTQMNKALQKLKQGEATDMKAEVDKVLKLAAKLAATKDPIENQKLQQQLAAQMQQLNDAMSQAQSSQLADAMQQALQQMNMAQQAAQGQQSQLSQQAMQAMAQSLDLARMQMDQMAQSVNDLDALNQAMNAMNKAMSANSQNALDGSQCHGCNGMSDYVRLYNQLLAQGGGQGRPGQQGQGKLNLPIRQETGGKGGAFGGPGQGDGGVAPEDPSQATTFKDDKSPTHLKAGRILASLKIPELALPGEIKMDYKTALADLQRAIAEAIETEDVPPGYRETIEKYFRNHYNEAPELPIEPVPAQRDSELTPN